MSSQPPPDTLDVPEARAFYAWIVLDDSLDVMEGHAGRIAAGDPAELAPGEEPWTVAESLAWVLEEELEYQLTADTAAVPHLDATLARDLLDAAVDRINLGALAEATPRLRGRPPWGAAPARSDAGPQPVARGRGAARARINRSPTPRGRRVAERPDGPRVLARAGRADSGRRGAYPGGPLVT